MCFQTIITIGKKNVLR